MKPNASTIFTVPFITLLKISLKGFIYIEIDDVH